jgi:hypothetical protein
MQPGEAATVQPGEAATVRPGEASIKVSRATRT